MSKHTMIPMVVKGMRRASLISALVFFTASIASGQIVVPDEQIVPEISKEQLHPSAQEKISNSLQDAPGDKAKSADEGDSATGDPILDDVLDVIRKQGSVLRGSDLDPEAETPSISLEEEFQTQDRSVPAPSSEAVRVRSSYFVAEQLLRSARVLETLDGMSDRRAELVHSMRSQAAKLLIDAISTELRPIQP